MKNYDYKKGKERVIEILNDSNEIEEKDKVPTEGEFSFHNGYFSNVTAVFVDIRESTKLFSENKKTSTAKIIRSFTSEVIEILKEDENLREIGIRGDCVYAIYTIKTEEETYNIASKVFYVNTFMKMLNELLLAKNMLTINVGIGVSSAKELVIKAGREKSGVNNLVWIGKAVTYASKFSALANKDGYNKIIISDNFYDNLINTLYRKYSKEEVDNWFSIHYLDDYGYFYDCNVVKSEFKKWINGGMKNE